LLLFFHEKIFKFFIILYYINHILLLLKKIFSHNIYQTAPFYRQLTVVVFQPLRLWGMLGIPNFFLKSLFPNDVSTPHVIYHFEKCVTISWDCDTSYGNQLLEKKKLGCLAFLYGYSVIAR